MIKEALKGLIKSQINESILIGKVKKVNGQTCDVLPLGGEAELLDVRLMATIDDNDDGLLITPKVGSFVAVAIFSHEAGEAVVVMFSEIESIQEKGIKGSFKRDLKQGKYELNAEETVFNNGTNGGLVNVQPLVQDLTTIKVFLQTLQIAIQSAPVVPTDGGASFKAALMTAVSGLQLPAISGYEDEKIKH